MDVVRKIESQETNASDRPLLDVIISDSGSEDTDLIIDVTQPI